MIPLSINGIIHKAVFHTTNVQISHWGYPLYVCLIPLNSIHLIILSRREERGETLLNKDRKICRKK